MKVTKEQLIWLNTFAKNNTLNDDEKQLIDSLKRIYISDAILDEVAKGLNAKEAISKILGEKMFAHLIKGLYLDADKGAVRCSF